MKIIISEQIHLSEIRTSDQAACVEHLREREIYDHTLRIPFPYGAAEFGAWLARMDQAKDRQSPPTNWAIRNAADYLIGACGLDDRGEGQTHRAEIGYWLAKPYWGRGIASAVVRRVCAYAFEELGLVKITAHVFATNPASARVLEKCGFEPEGYLKKHYLKDGRYLDARAFGLLK
jgi:[ribosomal protein S5]-alanine N-acetyltransferase